MFRQKFMKRKQRIRRFKKHEFDSMKYKMSFQNQQTSNVLASEVHEHIPAQLSTKQMIGLYFQNYPCLKRCMKSKNFDQSRFFRVGLTKLTTRLSIENIVRDIQNSKLICSHYRSTEMGKALTKSHIQHNPKQLIDLLSEFSEPEPD